MTHGFVLTAQAGEEGSGINSSLADVKVLQDVGVGCWISEAINKGYVQYASSDNYFVVTIGKAYGLAELARNLMIYLQGDGAVNDFVEAHLGQYCVVVFDRIQKKYTLVSDASGVRSLFYTVVDTQLYIASSVGMLRQVLGDSICKRNVAGESFMLRYVFLPPGQTVYDQVYELPPALSAVLPEGSTVLENKSAVSPVSKAQVKNDDYLTQLSSLLMSVCKEQAGDAKRIAVLLGGFDSALVASMLVRLGYDVETFSFKYADEEYNQPHVEALADYLSIKHHWVDINHKVIEQGLETYSRHCNSPTVWPNYVIQTQHICNIMAEQGFDACFSGDGCDTAFMGYPSTYRRGGVYQKVPQLPVGLVEVLVGLLDKSRLELLMGHIYRVGLSLLRSSSYPHIKRPLRSFQLFDPLSYRRLTGVNSDFDGDAVFSALEAKTEGFSYERKMYFGKSLFSPNRAKLVGSADLAGFTVDSPYMHPSIKAFAQSLPDEVLRPKEGGAKEGKELLMKMAEAEKLLPADIIYQKKLAAIKSPIDEWFSGELASFSIAQCNKLPFAANHNYIDSLIKDLQVEKVYKDYFSDDRVVSLAISMLVTYAAYF